MPRTRSPLRSTSPDRRFIAGGTDFLQLWKAGLATPSAVLDINELPLRTITASEGGLTIGALARLSDVAVDAGVERDYSLISEAILASASRQIRAMATVGGNLLQRTRCPYFRGAFSACNKLVEGSGCAMRDGESRTAAIFGADAACVATQPSDLAVALAALDAQISIEGSQGSRTVAVCDFYRRPGDPASLDTHIAPGEIVTAVHIPRARSVASRSTYLKVRDRASFEFAVVSVAAVVDVTDGVILSARLAAGGVAPGPWRLTAAERFLVGQVPSRAALEGAADAAIMGAEPFGAAAFKVQLLRRSVLRALRTTVDPR